MTLVRPNVEMDPPCATTETFITLHQLSFVLHRLVGTPISGYGALQKQTTESRVPRVDARLNVD